MGSTTLPIRLSVGTEQNGSRQAVVGSGTTSISLLLIAFHPLIEDPSSPDPSLNSVSVSSFVGILKCCQVPIRSTNLRSTICTLVFFANSNTSRTFIPSSFQTHTRTGWSWSIVTLRWLLKRYRSVAAPPAESVQSGRGLQSCAHAHP